MLEWTSPVRLFLPPSYILKAIGRFTSVGWIIDNVILSRKTIGLHIKFLRFFFLFIKDFIITFHELTFTSLITWSVPSPPWDTIYYDLYRYIACLVLAVWIGIGKWPFEEIRIYFVNNSKNHLQKLWFFIWLWIHSADANITMIIQILYSIFKRLPHHLLSKRFSPWL